MHLAVCSLCCSEDWKLLKMKWHSKDYSDWADQNICWVHITILVILRSGAHADRELSCAEHCSCKQPNLTCSKTGLKQPLKSRHNKGLNEQMVV